MGIRKISSAKYYQVGESGYMQFEMNLLESRKNMYIDNVFDTDRLMLIIQHTLHNNQTRIKVGYNL